ncbi:CLUMA_CG010217, isoform A [Clunio marinus]|uniref:CLUMA_CG010217, isoform A n=1 Tax=Clunio marinus TaxID=568069 RepID=A0A1J1ID26_9DIPT|nr:CLUMA_CG010217, isoform A [Clunio marinus]
MNELSGNNTVCVGSRNDCVYQPSTSSGTIKPLIMTMTKKTLKLIAFKDPEFPHHKRINNRDLNKKSLLPKVGPNSGYYRVSIQTGNFVWQVPEISKVHTP